MKKHPFYIILIILGGIIAVADLAFLVYLGVTLGEMIAGKIFLPAVFQTICTAAAISNGIVALYAIIYVTVLRK